MGKFGIYPSISPETAMRRELNLPSARLRGHHTCAEEKRIQWQATKQLAS
jgi:hypothetical protein